MATKIAVHPHTAKMIAAFKAADPEYKPRGKGNIHLRDMLARMSEEEAAREIAEQAELLARLHAAKARMVAAFNARCDANMAAWRASCATPSLAAPREIGAAWRNGSFAGSKDPAWQVA